ncbi:hypothetical protein CYY_008845 [Polysphondylium violaceum]|uniref:Uncharacterized protein n=1 Tax=Polysphondylium violaceum TaxID=133409 RepID=A0A8J4UWL7_9MYCE|nr:hypothetical protein CYY_008845 [Polysphondylium violaceum]
MTIFASLSSMSGSFKPTGNSAISKSIMSNKTGANNVACGGCGGYGDSSSYYYYYSSSSSSSTVQVQLNVNVGGLFGSGNSGCY